MLRGARIDLESSAEAAQKLVEVYERDLEAREVSDDMLKAVRTIVTGLQGALGKIADTIDKEFGKDKHPYFSIEADPARFPARLERNLPGLQASHPDIAAAIERQQPYHPGHEILGLLPDLYRVNHHHDFSVQERRETQSVDIRVGGQVLMTMGTHGMTLGGPPPWRGVLVERKQDASIDIPENAVPIGEAMIMEMTRHEDGSTDFYINGKKVGQSPAGLQAVDDKYIDWYFVKPEASVLGTLIPLHNLCAQACVEVWDSAGL